MTLWRSSSDRNPRRLLVEQLERRVLLQGSIVLNTGTLEFSGRVDHNTVAVVLNTPAQVLEVTIDGNPPESFSVFQVQDLSLLGLLSILEQEMTRSKSVLPS